MKLNYHHLFYFWYVAKRGHLTLSAKELCVSQSALSMQIKQLEQRFDVKLFERDGRKLTLTDTGQIALNYAEDIFSKGKELTAILTNERVEQKNQLRIGAVSTLSRNFQEEFLKPLILRADVKLILQAGRFNDLLLSLSTHHLDIVLSNIPIQLGSDDSLQCRCIAKQKVSIIGRLTGNKTSFNFPDDLANHALILPAVGSEIRQSFDLLCETWDITPNIAAEVDDMAMLRLLARDSDNLAVLPKVVVKDELEMGLLDEIATLPSVFENFYAISAKRKYTNPLVKKLLEFQSL